MLAVHTLELGEDEVELAFVVRLRKANLGYCLGVQLRWIFKGTIIGGFVSFSLVPLLAGNLTTTTAYAFCGII